MKLFQAILCEAMLFFAVLWLALSAQNAFAENVSPVTTLYARTEAPLTTYLDRLPLAYLKFLETLNQRTQVSKPLESGQEPAQAQLWIFVMSDFTEGARLPGVVRTLFDAHIDPNTDSRMRYLEFSLEGVGDKAVVFIFTDNHPTGFNTECLLAADTYTTVLDQLSQSQLLDYRSECELPS